MRLATAFIAAIILPALLITAFYLYGQFSMFDTDDPYIWIRTRKWLIASIYVSGAYVLLLGVPAFFLMRWLNAIRWWSTIGVGFLLGAIPVAILSWPVHPKGNFSASVNGIPTIVDGVPTFEGWLQYLYNFSSVGMLGVAGALAFWLVWKRSPNNRLQIDAATPRD